MKPIASYQPLSVSQQTSSSATPTRNVDTKRGDVLWLTFAEMFGSKLTAQFGEECPTAWHRILAELTDDQVGRGLRWLRDEGREWPPSAPEFWRLCKKPEPPRPPTMLALPAPRYPKEKGRERVAELRAILRR